MSTGSKSKRRQKIRVIDNPVQVQGFNVQRISLPEANPDWFVESHREWAKNVNLVTKLHNGWVRKQRRAVWLGLALGALLVLSWLGLLYALAA